MDAKDLIESRKPLIAYFSGPIGTGRFHNLVNFVTTLYQPGPSQIAQLQDILSDYPQIVWFSGSRMLLDQSQKTVEQCSAPIMKYSHFEVYNLAKLNDYIKNYKNLIIVMNESCLQPQSGVIAGKAREMKTIVQLVTQAKVSLLVEGMTVPMSIKYGAQVGFTWVDNKFIIEKNLLSSAESE